MTKSFKVFFIVVILCQCVGFAQKDTIVAKIPARILLSEHKQSNFRISPNGKLFLEVLKENFETNIVIIDIDGYKLKNRIPMGSASLGEVVWLTNERLLYEKSGEIFAIDIDGSNKLKLVNRRAEKRVKNLYKYYLNYRYNSILAAVRDEEDEILIEAFDGDGNAYVKQVNVFTGETETLLDGSKLKVNKWFADKNGQINLGARVDDDSWTYVRRGVNSNDWYPIEINLGGRFHPFKLEGESFFKDNILLVDTDFNSDVVYLASNIGTDKRSLLKYDLKKRSVLDTIISDTNCDIMDDTGADIRLLFDHREKELGGVRYEGVMPEFRPLTGNFLEVRSKLDKKYSALVNDIIDHDRDFNRFVVYQWSDVYAGNIGIYDVTSEQYYVMFHFNSELNNYKLSKTRNISINTEDGYVLPAYLTLPPKYKEQDKVPLVVVPHGGPWARDYWGLDVYSQFFASRNYAVLRVNYRGSTGFGKKHFKAGIEGLGSEMIGDIVHATKEVVGKYKIDENSVFIYGHSYGGYATYMALAKYPGLYRAGVAVAAPTDIKKIMKLQKKEGNDFSYDYWKQALGENGTAYYKEVSPINYVESINSPLLVVHGKYDKVVPVEHAEDMEKRFKKLNKTNAVFRTIQFLGHSLEDSNSHGYILKEADEFFMESLK